MVVIILMGMAVPVVVIIPVVVTILATHHYCEGSENQDEVIWAKGIHGGVVRNCAAKRGQKYNAILVSSHL